MNDREMNDSEMNEINEMNDYRSKECCEKFSNLNESFWNYEVERDMILTEIKTDPEKLSKNIWKKYLSFDKFCKRKSGHGDLYSPNMCIPCFNLSIMIDHDINDPKKNFKVMDKNLIVIKKSIGNLNAEVSERDKIMASNFLKKNKVMLSCGSQDVSDLTFFRSDKFTNNVLVWWAVSKIFSLENVRNLNLYTSYICGNDGFLLTDFPQIGGYDKLIEYQRKKGIPDEDTSELIIQKLKQKLMILSDYFFSHGKPNLQRLTFSESENDKEDFELHIIDFTYSSITIGKVRIYPKSVRANMMLENGKMTIDIQDGMYKIHEDKEILFEYIRHAGLPFYSTSFDYYNFMISLMKKPSFFQAVYQRENLKSEWENLWEIDDIPIVNEMIRQNKRTCEILSNKWLLCNPFL